MQITLQQGTKRETFTVALKLSLLISDDHEHTATGLLSFFGSAESERGKRMWLLIQSRLSSLAILVDTSSFPH